MKARIRFVKFEQALAMQVLEMDEKFRKKDKFDPQFETSNGVKIFSACSPCISSLMVEIFLRGYDKEEDLCVSSKHFSSNTERDDYLCEVLFALEEWSEKWAGWKLYAEENDIKEKANDFILTV